MKNTVRILIFCLVAASSLSGCGCRAFTYKNASRTSFLRVVTKTGEFEVEIPNGIDAQTLVSLNTALANAQIVDLEVVKQDAQRQTRLDTLTVLKWSLWSGCFLGFLAAQVLCFLVVLSKKEKA